MSQHQLATNPYTTNMEKDMDNTNMEKDMEKDMEKVMDLDKSQDPFAGEEVGGVRYRTMKWW